MSNDTYICPRCKENLEFPEKLEDNSYRCPNCNKLIFFPIPGVEKGMNIGGFILERNIGSGAMGDVWVAHQESMDRKIALKILSPSLTRDKSFINRFKKEIKITAKFTHPNIVAAHDAGNDKGLHFLAMTYIEGLSLSDEIRVQGAFPEDKALNLIRHIASALTYLWNDFHVLHRDIKPDNIIIDKNGDAQLLDMGIAKTFAPGETITGTNVTVGTPYYMSPEQIIGEENLDARSDIYSLGITLYQLLTANLPFCGKTTGAVFQKHLAAKFQPARTINPLISKQCDALLKTMMSKEKENRQSCWEEVISDIDLVLNKKYPVSGGLPPNTKKKNFALTAVVIATLTILAACVFPFLLPEKKNINPLGAHSVEKIKEQTKGADATKTPSVELNVKKQDNSGKQSPSHQKDAKMGRNTAHVRSSENGSVDKVTEKANKPGNNDSLSANDIKEWGWAKPLTVAILPFNERNSSVKGMGNQVSDLLFTSLVENSNLWLVEREEIKKILDEAELNLSGMVNPAQANKIGQLSGARIIITGSVFKVNGKAIIVAKILSTETGKLSGAKVQGTQPIDKLLIDLSRQISDNIRKKGKSLLPVIKKRADLIASLKLKIGNKKSPRLYVSISEEHIGQRPTDPVAQTEIQSICKDLGFEVTENEGEAEILIKGKGFSEFSTRRGKLVSIKARLEVKALDKNDNVIAVDSQTDIQVGLAEQVTGKQALQEASAKIAERLLPKICK